MNIKAQGIRHKAQGTRHQSLALGLLPIALSLLPLLALDIPKIHPPDQPIDTNTRTITAIGTIHDGDTFTCDIDAIRLGQMHVGLNAIRIRLKDVSAYEINDPDPARKAVAEQERSALAKLILSAKTLTVTLHRQTHDRYEGDVWADGINVNATMRTYPQGGR